MSIRTMCSKDTPGARLDEHWSKPDQPIYVETTHVGQVLALREHNGYDDSDFYALVWEPGANEPREIQYATTRGWTYPNGASIDATPELRERYEAHLAGLRQAAAERRARCEAATPTIGKRVRVVRGRKVPIGTVGAVVWYGQARVYGANYPNGYKAHARDQHRLVDSLLPPATGLKEGMRVGILVDGTQDKLFLSAKNVDVIDELNHTSPRLTVSQRAVPNHALPRLKP